MSKPKFKVFYPENYPDKELASKKYKPPEKGMVVMNGGGVMFLFIGERYYPSLRPLSEVIPQYDVVWTNTG